MTQPIQRPYVWFNGAIVPWESATLHATDTIWSGIQSVFEGVRAYWQEDAGAMHLFRLRDHLLRLRQSTRLVRLALPYDPLVLLEDLPRLLRQNAIREDTYIRIVAFPTERRMASAVDEEVVNLLVDTSPYPSHLADDRLRHVQVSSYTRISEAVMSPRAKSIANYRNSDLAIREARLAGYDGAILLNRLGEVAEGAWSSVFLVRDGALITPDLTSDVLESITRDTVIALARDRLTLPVVERRVARSELYLADEAFLAGTAAELQPLASVDRYTLGDGGVGPITGRLRHLYEDVVRGRHGGYPEWLTSQLV